MTRRSAKVVHAATRAGDRRGEYSTSTRRTLVARATELFTEHGYAGTSLDEVVAAADVTKGALYHHYAGKQALFEAVFEATEEAAVKNISAEVRRADDPWDRATAGVRAFMAVCRQPRFRRIVMQEGPVVLGHERFREADERSTYGLVRDIVSDVLASAGQERGAEIAPSIVETFTRVFYGAMTAAGTSVASAEDPEAAGHEVETVIGIVLAGLRQLAESGVDLSDPAATRPPADTGAP